MTLLQRLLTRSFDQPLESDDSTLAARFGAVESFTGKRVGEAEAARTAAVYASVRILSETVASLPTHVVQRSGATRKVQHSHPVQGLINEAPNPEMDAGEFWRFMLVFALFGGDAYAWIERGEAGQPRALWPVPAAQVAIGRDRKRELYYDLSLTEDQAGPGHERYFRVGQEDVMHVKAFGLGRLHGMSPLQAARESIGTSRAAQEYAGRFYRNDASPGGLIEVPEELTDEQFERLEDGWNRAHRGVDRSHMLAILESGASWRQVGISPQDAEFINTRKFELGEIARIFGVPPHLIGDTEKSTSWGTGIEQQNIGFLTYSLMPWINRLERVATRSLLRQGPFADDSLYVKWQPDALLRGDIQARYQAYAIGRQWGFESTNSILELEDRDPVDGGDNYLVPENMRRVLGDGEEDVRDLQRRIDAAVELVRGGFDPEQAAARLGIDVDHLGAMPVTLQANTVTVGEGNADRSVEVRASQQVRDGEVDATLVALRRYFDRQRDELSERVGALRPATFRELWDEDRWDEELTGMFRRLAGQTAAAYARQVDAQFDPDDRMSQWLAANSKIAAQEVNASTLSYLDGRLAEAPDDDTRQVVTAAYATVAGGRAEQIARTRVSTVGQRAQNEAAEQSPQVRRKTWRVTSDNPRSSHASVDGESVPLGERFSNGARYPGDPELPVDERAGCTCDLSFD